MDRGREDRESKLKKKIESEMERRGEERNMEI